MKKLYLFAMLGVAFGFTACEDQLDIPQKATLTTETFYQTDADAEKALASAYEQFQCNTMVVQWVLVSIPLQGFWLTTPVTM